MYLRYLEVERDLGLDGSRWKSAPVSRTLVNFPLLGWLDYNTPALALKCCKQLKGAFVAS